MDLSSKLENLIELSSKIRFFVPSTTEVTEEIDSSEIVTRVQSKFSEMFGGATTYNAIGCWTSPVAGLVKEKVTVVASFCNEKALEENIEEVLEMAKTIKAEMSQEAIALEINNKLYLV